MAEAVNVITTFTQRARRFFTSREHMVLAPYARQRTPLARALRRLLVLAILLALGSLYGYLVAALPTQLLVPLILPIAVIAMMVIWALPDSSKPPERALVKWFLAFLVVAGLWPNYLAIAFPGLPWISFRRLILPIVTLLLLLSLSISSDFRKRLADTANATPLVWQLVAFFVFLQLLSVPMAVAPVAALNTFVNNQMQWTVVFVVTIVALRDPLNMRRLFKVLAVTAIILVVMGALEAPRQKPIWADHLPAFLRMDPNAPGVSGVFRGGKYRIVGPFSHPLVYGEYLVLMAPIILYFMVTANTLRARAAWFLIDLAAFVCVLGTQGRSAFGGYMFVHAAFIGLVAIRQWLHEKGKLLGPFTVMTYAGTVVLVFGAFLGIGRLRERLLGSAAEAASNIGREAQIAAWPGAIMRNWPQGAGPRQGAEILGTRNPAGEPSIDNYFIWISLDYGVLGMIVYFGMIALAAYMMVRVALSDRGRNGLHAVVIACMLGLYLFSKWYLSQEDNHYLPFVMLGAAVAIMAQQRNEAKASKPAPEKAAVPGPRRRPLQLLARSSKALP